MRKRLFHLLLASALATVLWASVLHTAAQDGTETYISSDRLTSFSYPTGWYVEEEIDWGTIYIANTIDARYDYGALDRDMPSGEVVLRLTPPNKMEQSIFRGDPPITDLAELVSIFQPGNEPPQIQMRTIGGKRAARLQTQRWNCGNIFWAFEVAPGVNAVLELCAAPGEEEQYEHYGEALIASLEYNAPPTAQTTDLPAGVVWQYVEAVDEEHDALEFSDLAVGVDDRIYLVDRAYGNVYIFRADGTFEYFKPIFGALQAIAPMPDGSVWVFRSYSRLDRIILETEDYLASCYFDQIVQDDFMLYGVHMVVDPEDGTLYVAGMTIGVGGAPGEVMVYKVSPEGELLETYKVAEIPHEGFIGNVYIAFGPEGHLYIAPSRNPEGVIVMTKQGEIVRKELANAIASYTSLCGFGVQEDGTMLLIPCGHGAIWRFSAENALSGVYGENILQVYPTTTPVPNQGPTAAPVYQGDQFEVVVITTTPLPTAIFADRPQPTVVYDVQGLGVLSNGDVVYVDVRPGWWQLVRAQAPGR